MALYEAGLEQGVTAQFILVNKKESPLIDYFNKKDVPCFFVESKAKGIDKEFETKALELCRQHKVEWLFLAGFLKILSPDFLCEFKEENIAKVINIHPSLLPKYPGLGGYKKAFENGDAEYGHTIHLVTEGVDEGPILYQKKLSRKEGDSFDDFVSRGKSEENRSYAQVLKKLIRERITMVGGIPRIEMKDNLC